MTTDEARRFINEGRARYDVMGWWIAHEIGGELEWFRVTEQDASVLAACGRAPVSEEGGQRDELVAEIARLNVEQDVARCVLEEVRDSVYIAATGWYALSPVTMEKVRTVLKDTEDRQ